MASSSFEVYFEKIIFVLLFFYFFFQQIQQQRKRRFPSHCINCHIRKNWLSLSCKTLIENNDNLQRNLNINNDKIYLIVHTGDTNEATIARKGKYPRAWLCFSYLKCSLSSGHGPPQIILLFQIFYLLSCPIEIIIGGVHQKAARTLKRADMAYS